MNKSLFIAGQVLSFAATVTVGVTVGIVVANALTMGSIAKFAVGYVTGCAAARITEDVINASKLVIVLPTKTEES